MPYESGTWPPRCSNHEIEMQRIEQPDNRVLYRCALCVQCGIEQAREKLAYHLNYRPVLNV